MFEFFKKNLRRRLITVLLVVSVIPVSIIACLSLWYSYNALEQSIFTNLISIRDNGKNIIFNMFDSKISALKTLSSMARTIVYFEDSSKQTAQKSAVNNTGSMFTKNEEFYKKILENEHFSDMFFINLRGDFIFNIYRKDLTSGRNMKDVPEGSVLKKCYNEVMRSGMTVVTDISIGKYFANGIVVMYIGMPIRDSFDKIIGVAVVQIRGSEIDKLLSTSSEFGTTSEICIVGADYLKRNMSRFNTEDILKTRVKTDAVALAFADKSGTRIIKDSRNVEMLSSYSLLNFSKLKNVKCDFRWAIVVDIEKSEAFADIYELIRDIFMAVAIIVLLVIVIGFIFASSISRPLRIISDKARKISHKDLTVERDKGIEDREDEIGILASSFNEMLDTLTQQVTQISNSASELSLSITEISSTTTEIAASSVQINTSVNQITTTSEELRQVNLNSYERAKELVSQSEKITVTAHDGTSAIKNSQEGIKKISVEMDFIAKNITRLGELSQHVEEIINAVNSFSDQTNLLSINASIEAAKAGEYGKGFAVVAREVKNLAERSKDSTKQITSILTDIQKAAAITVVAAERGSKSVTEGLSLFEISENSITMLSETIKVAVDNAIQMSIVSKEQLSGIDQIVRAIEGIKESIEQNVDGTKQLETAVKSIESLSYSLEASARIFKTTNKQ